MILTRLTDNHLKDVRLATLSLDTLSSRSVADHSQVTSYDNLGREIEYSILLLLENGFTFSDLFS